MPDLRTVATIDDLAKLARRRMPRFAFDYLEGGAGDGAGVMRNRRSLEKIVLVPKALRGAAPEIGTDLFGFEYSMPFGIAPTGPNNLLWPRADFILGEIARKENIPAVLSTMATTRIEDFVKVAGGNTWFQLYPLRSERVTDHLLARVRDSGVRILIITIDVVTNATRNRDVRNGFNEPGFLRSKRFILDVLSRPRWLLGQLQHGRPTLANLGPYIGAGALDEQAARDASDLLLHAVTWEHLKRLRDRWQGALVIKGILDAEDAALALELGADGIWVSNHGGRQFESAPAAIDAVPAVKAVVGNRAKILMDGGIRSGEDILKARICGADMVFSGRALLYGVAAAGFAGAQHGARLLRTDIRRALAQIGAPSYAELDRRWLWSAG